eukprot:m.242732 g.242732  ORF g.242732 m.242732 type:complete len:180 (+) comp17138_c0_seq1:131-670(+)
MQTLKVFAVAIAVVLLCFAVVDAKKKKNEKECEVCKKVVGKFIEQAKSDNVDLTDNEGIENIIRNYCKNARITKENRFCYYIGGTDDAATGLLREVSGPIGRYMPPAAICKKLQKKDSQICELEYEEPIDLKTIDLSKQRVKVLKKILDEQFGDACKGCIEKEDYIRRIEEFKQQHAEL